MTVLGNIVAVTSIIAVVSLIQGLNASVTSAIMSQAGADSFSIQQFPVTRSDEEFDEVRGNPRITMQEARAIKRVGGDSVGAVMAELQGSGRVTYRDQSIDNTQRSRRQRRVRQLLDADAERGRLMSPTEVDTSRPVAVLGWQTADRLFGSTVDPIDKMIQIEGVHFRVVGVAQQARVAARAVAGRVRDHPARAVPDDFRLAPLAVADGQAARSVRASPAAMDDATVALRIARAAQAEAAATTSACSRRTRSSTSTTRPPTASSRCWSASWRSRSWSAAS